MRQEMKQAMASLVEEQIAVSRATVVEHGPRVSTQMRGGCSSKEECEKWKGVWIQDKNGKYYCSGTYICKDSGTGDWD